jgi:ASCH domain
MRGPAEDTLGGAESLPKNADNDAMRILSIRQPWAHLIVSGAKNIENRTRPTPYRGPFLIHASKTIDKEACRRYRLDPSELETGGVVGVAEIVDCVTSHRSKWFTGPYGYVLRRRRKLPFIEWRGALGLRRAPNALLKRLTKSALRE